MSNHQKMIHQKICGGSFNVNTRKVKFNIKRVKALGRQKMSDAKLASSIFRESKKYKNVSTPADLVKTCIKQWELDANAITEFKCLHEKICKLYLDIIDNSGINIIEPAETEPRPGNYTAASTRLSSIKWVGYPGGKVKGFCPFEPVVRLAQLAAFPIDYFRPGGVELSFEKMPDVKPPNLDSIPKFPSNKVSLSDRILWIEPHLLKWEEYYIKLIDALELVIKDIDSIHLNDL